MNHTFLIKNIWKNTEEYLFQHFGRFIRYILYCNTYVLKLLYQIDIIKTTHDGMNTI